LESAGARLKKIRLEKGLSLQDVQKKTKVHLNILRAIEGDGLTGVNPVYLKGFLKIYCKFLGVEPKEYLEDHREAEAEVREVEEKKESSPSRPSLRLGRSIAFVKRTSVKLRTFRPTKEVKLAFIFILAAFVFIFALFKLGQFISSKRAKAPLAKQEANLEKKEGKAKPKPAANQDSGAKKKVIASGIKLGIKANQDCWIALKVDGKLVFQRVLKKGRFESWSAKKKMELSLGNAGGVELEVNGQFFSNLGRRGQVLKNIIITKDGLSVIR